MSNHVGLPFRRLNTLVVPSRRALIAAIVAAGLFTALPARAPAQVNTGFETGDFTGWLQAGTSAASIVGLSFGSGPTEGTVEALVTNGPGVAAAALHTFFGLPPGALAGLNNGDPVQGAGVRQVFSGAPGAWFVIDWNFLTNENTPSTFNDFGFAVVDGVAMRLANTQFPSFLPLSASFSDQTGFHPLCFTIGSGGVVSIGLGVMDVGDTSIDSAVLIDNLRPTIDGDGDGRADPCDNCPGAANPAQGDADADGIGDACDACVGDGSVDGDGDAVCDGADNCPEVANPGQEDTDGDGVGDACNSADDADGDEWADGLDDCPAIANPGQADSDFDGFGDACDACFGAGDSDRDGDGLCDGNDNCPAVPNPGQADDDFDFFGNACDTCVGPGPADADGDARCDLVDNCPTTFNPGQQDGDFDGRGNACDACIGFSDLDADGDGFCDERDNCPNTANPSQSDCDFDGIGDGCDGNASDGDGDGVDDACDNCPTLPNVDQQDANGDGIGEVCAVQGRLDSTGCYRASDTLAPPDGTEPVFNFTDISASGAVVPIGSHQVSGAVPIGFNFVFYGTSYSQVFVSSNGFLTFLNDGNEGCCGGVIPQTSSPNAVAAGLWGHLHPSVGEVSRQTLGTAPDRQFVLEFENVDNADTGTQQTWQIILHETSNEIEVQYVNADGTFVTGGIEDASGRRGLQWAGPEPVALVNQAVRYVPTSGLVADGDGDGPVDCLDNCPTLPNPGQADSDNDGFGDACDTCVGPGASDSDLDGSCDGGDNCPTVPNPNQLDQDFDGLGDACDVCVGPGTVDTDGDGFCNSADNCPATVNPGQQDGDFDGRGDACDPCLGFTDLDDDADGICNDRDNCRTVPNPSQTNCDFDGFGDACDPDTVDGDGDAVADACDNCPGLANPDQADANGDGTGDACGVQGQLDTRGCYRASDTIAPPDGTEPTFAFIDISASGTVVPIASHVVSGAIPIGFGFDFYGVDYSQVFVSSNGFITFLPDQFEGCCGSPLPEPFNPNGLIAGLWGHLHPTFGEVLSETRGVAPNRQFVVEFQAVANVDFGRDQTFEIILNEGTNDIVVQYADASFGTVGIEDPTGTLGLQWAGTTSVFLSLMNEAVRFAPTAGLSNDDDSDGAPNCVDNCPGVANPSQADTDHDGVGDACNDAADADGDEWANTRDNCPDTPNVDQLDGDFDGVGDACDTCTLDGVRGPVEECDDGNFDDSDCCSVFCRAASAGQVCGGTDLSCALGGGTCDNAGLCQIALRPAGTPCRAATGACDAAEQCDGSQPGCPFDQVAESGVGCRPAVGQCDLSEFCDGFSKSCPPDLKGTLTCRPANNACDVAEQCDGVANDCPADIRLPDGDSCSDGAFCNGVEHCEAGSCVPGPRPCAGACNESTAMCGGCPPVAQSCREAGRSTLVMKASDDAAKQKLVWKWLRGEATAVADFGDPAATTLYLLCFYASTDQVLIPASDIRTPAHATNWQPIGSKGFKYSDATGAADGVQKIVLKSGGAGKAKTMLIGRGAALPLVTLPLGDAQFPLTVQLVNESTCWSSTFDAAKRNDDKGLKAKTD